VVELNSTNTTGDNMIDHAGVTISDPKKSRAFYEAALKSIGYSVLMEVPKEYTEGRVVLGLGEPPKADFWIVEGKPSGVRNHVAFSAKTRAQVDAFYAAAMGAGGEDNGKPGLRPEYNATYYAAFVRDPDGHNIEVVCHAP
jgi:catechol 2,3-dioxygenase-like lactoylglutathione lyase family enzyme